MKKLLLKILNWLNDTPAYYGFINNRDAYSAEFLEQSARQEPDITLGQFMKEMKMMNECVAKNGLCVVEGGQARDGTEEDIKDLQQDFERSAAIEEMKSRNEEGN